MYEPICYRFEILDATVTDVITNTLQQSMALNDYALVNIKSEPLFRIVA